MFGFYGIFLLQFQFLMHSIFRVMKTSLDTHKLRRMIVNYYFMLFHGGYFSVSGFLSPSSKLSLSVFTWTRFYYTMDFTGFQTNFYAVLLNSDIITSSTFLRCFDYKELLENWFLFSSVLLKDLAYRYSYQEEFYPFLAMRNTWVL